MATCACCEYQSLTTLEDVASRISEKERLKACLTLLAISNDGYYRFYRCKKCEQYWQSTMWEWMEPLPDGLVNRLDEVLYSVPPKDTEGWKTHPYPDPIPGILARSKMHKIEADLGPEIGPEKCRIAHCPRLRIVHSVFCRQHHMESLQRIGASPTPAE